jgi:hypothetical protein
MEVMKKLLRLVLAAVVIIVACGAAMYIVYSNKYSVHSTKTETIKPEYIYDEDPDLAPYREQLRDKYKNISAVSP